MQEIKPGMIFGNITVLEGPFVKVYENKRAVNIIKVQCNKCKRVYTTQVWKFINMNNKESCRKCRQVEHGDHGTRLYRIWGKMKQRCRPGYKSDRSQYYNEKGIKYCEDWQYYKNFKKWALDNGYTESLTIDRIDSNGNYEPNNCRWASYSVQNSNRTYTKKINNTGYVGLKIYKYKGNIKYIAKITFNNEVKRIGTYSTKKEAVEARNNYIKINNLPHTTQEYIEESQV